MKNAHVRDIRVIDMLVIKVGLFLGIFASAGTLNCTRTCALIRRSMW